MKLSEIDKSIIESQCQPLIEKLKAQYISKNPNKRLSYLADVYLKWYREYLYFCEKLKSESPNRIADEFEDKFVRLRCAGKDKFDLSYMKHTGQWALVEYDLTLKECLEMIEGIPNFHPAG